MCRVSADADVSETVNVWEVRRDCMKVGSLFFFINFLDCEIRFRVVVVFLSEEVPAN